MHPALSVVLATAVAAAAVPCGYRLASGPESCCGPDRVEDSAELLICAGMLAMLSPVGGPIPLAGWRAVFAVAVVGLAARWLRDRRCGHHALMAAAMLYMFVAMHGHGADPWFTAGEHSLGPWPLALAVVGYCIADLGISGWRAARMPSARGLGTARVRLGTRAVGSAAMGGMLVGML